MTIRTVILFLCVAQSVWVDQRVYASASNQSNLEAQAKHNEDTVLKILLPMLKSEALVGRVYYYGACHVGTSEPVAFPFVEVRTPPKDARGLAQIRDVFLNQTNVSVTQKYSNIVEIDIGKGPSEVLETEISVLNLVPLEQYNADIAIAAIENNEQVKLAMRKLGVRTPVTLFEELIAMPTTGLPHLTTPMTNLTMDRALDAVARTFDGIVLYGACTHPRLYTISFAPE